VAHAAGAGDLPPDGLLGPVVVADAGTGIAAGGTGRPGTDVMIFEIFSQKMAKKLSFCNSKQS
jgi:hypothetical protein